ncbi:MAG: diacylglycerol kinase family protein [Clostridiales bacterium]|nr:diacylglycerol kinase family protein [Clostridiales bacterium]
MKYAVLYNPTAGNGAAQGKVDSLKDTLAGDTLRFFNIFEENKNGFVEFFNKLQEDEAILLVGGDGTLNRFINDCEDRYLGKRFYYLPAGSGNDFWSDLGNKDSNCPIDITEIMKNLPQVTVNGKTQKFFNGIGFGIDGYCCEEGDRQRLKKPGTPVNYTAIAILGLLFHYKCPNATICVDGVEKQYKKVWLAPTMKGRYYGGGMIAAPEQDRADGKVSLVVWHGSGKLKTLMVFPSIFKGEHVNQTKYIEVIKGKEITVKFDRPTALQIDGETVVGVTEYTVKA